MECTCSIIQAKGCCRTISGSGGQAMANCRHCCTHVFHVRENRRVCFLVVVRQASSLICLYPSLFSCSYLLVFIWGLLGFYWLVFELSSFELCYLEIVPTQYWIRRGCVSRCFYLFKRLLLVQVLGNWVFVHGCVLCI